MKRPSFQFYPGDWMNDPALRMCSLAARGLWADMLAIMHDCVPYGHLAVNGKGILPGILARRVGASIDETEGLLAELRDHGVYSVSEEGWIYSKRMVRDERNRQVRAAGGVKSLENPNVPRPKQAGKDGRKDTFVPSPPSPSPSPSPKDYSEDFEVVWKAYPKRLGANSKVDAFKAYRARIRTGSTHDQILEGVNRYAAYCRAQGSEGTEYVKMASTFLGPARHFEDAWAVERQRQSAPRDVKGEALLVINEFRSKRVHHTAPQGGGSYAIPRPELDALAPAAKRAIQAIGGPHKIANHPDDTFPILASQFAAMYQAALSKDNAA